MTPIWSLLAFGAPVALEIQAPKEVRAGDPVVVSIRAKNVSSLPVTLVKPHPINASLGLRWQTELLHEGKPLLRDEQSLWSPRQWGGGYHISANRFIVIQPGESVEIYHDHFVSWLPQGQPTSKAAITEAPRSLLPAGQYKFLAHLTFSKANPPSERAFDRLSKGRYQRSWTGALNAEASFKVTG